MPLDIHYKGDKADEPLDILKKRFAKGEITKEQYEESKKKKIRVRGKNNKKY
ncbi:SHOCT domain-containing protein [Arenibacter nanhaiticus]|uniref:SHOCT domain-containing protein n=1 Tax=Arenibacter nanhaiticus TaxID=558155 RepID=UPI000A918DCF|nr:SHOCT domain-containing protein [Arenibacter nanhaiticus]